MGVNEALAIVWSLFVWMSLGGGGGVGGGTVKAPAGSSPHGREQDCLTKFLELKSHTVQLYYFKNGVL